MSRISWLAFLFGLLLTAIVFYRDARRSGWKRQLTESFGRFLVSRRLSLNERILLWIGLIFMFIPFLLTFRR